jgi:hypothetical protein
MSSSRIFTNATGAPVVKNRRWRKRGAQYEPPRRADHSLNAAVRRDGEGEWWCSLVLLRHSFCTTTR